MHAVLGLSPEKEAIRMKQFVWATDIHLDCLQTDDQVESFYQSLAAPNVDGVFLTGDISLAPSIVDHLVGLDEVIGKPIYFVLGNHDVWDGSINEVRSALVETMSERPNLKYMSALDYVSVSPDTAVVGHDGWYDAMLGRPEQTNFFMNDWHRIRDFSNAMGIMSVGMYGPRPNMPVVTSIARKLAFQAAEHVGRTASLAAKDHKNVIVLTHVPPFEEAHIHNGVKGSPGAMPWYTSKLMGDALTRVAQENPNVRFDVFCGHTHGQKDCQVMDNLFCHVGGAEYGDPQAQGIIQVP